MLLFLQRLVFPFSGFLVLSPHLAMFFLGDIFFLINIIHPDTSVSNSVSSDKPSSIYSLILWFILQTLLTCKLLYYKERAKGAERHLEWKGEISGKAVWEMGSRSRTLGPRLEGQGGGFQMINVRAECTEVWGVHRKKGTRERGSLLRWVLRGTYQVRPEAIVCFTLGTEWKCGTARNPQCFRAYVVDTGDRTCSFVCQARTLALWALSLALQCG